MGAKLWGDGVVGGGVVGASTCGGVVRAKLHDIITTSIDVHDIITTSIDVTGTRN